MFQLILATTIDDLPCLSIETFADARAIYGRACDSVDATAAEWGAMGTFLASAPIGASFTLHDIDSDEPVAVVTRIGAAS